MKRKNIKNVNVKTTNMKIIKKLLIRIYKMRKFLLLLLIAVLLFGLINSLPKNYEYEYKINGFKVTEKYDKESGLYYFTFSKDKMTYEYVLSHKYKNTKGLVNKIIYKNKCLSFYSELTDETICKNSEGKYTTPYYKKEITTKKTNEYKNIDIYNLGNYKYYVWNYNEFLSFDSEDVNNIKLFKSDIYSLDLITKYKNYLVIPDYDSNHYYQKFYLINKNNDNVSELELSKKIYFDSYFLGTYKKDLYIYDLDREKEYIVNMKNGKVEKTNYKILVDGEFKETSRIKLNKKNLFFKETTNFSYTLENDKLYYKTPITKILVTNLKVDKLVETIDEDAFFISEDVLYHVNINNGIEKVMAYTEWNFNSQNVFIFDK